MLKLKGKFIIKKIKKIKKNRGLKTCRKNFTLTERIELFQKVSNLHDRYVK